MTTRFHAVLGGLAAALLLVGAIGLARLPDFFMQLHAHTKASTLGIGSLLVAGMLLAADEGRAGFAALLITLFVFLTAPVLANMMAQAALHLLVTGKEVPPDEAVPERQRS